MSSFFKSATCISRAQVLVILSVLLLVTIGHSAFAASAAINPASYCAPGQAINSRQCAARIRKCRAYGAIMKFAGQGCRNSRGKPARDGGCQCSGYCAYFCSKPCVRDRQCYWNASEGACFVRASNAKGAPISNCLTSIIPTTAQPSQQPAIPTTMPTLSPSDSPSSSPSTASPATSGPSMTPSQTPSGALTIAPSQAPSEISSTSPTKGPVLVTCSLTTYETFTGIWLDGVDILSSVTPRDLRSRNEWFTTKLITFEIDPLSTSQYIAMSGRTWYEQPDKIGFTLVCRSDLLVWTFQTSIHDNWVGLNGPTFPVDWQTGSIAALETAQSSSFYCLYIAPYNEGWFENATKYDIVNIRPNVLNGSADTNQAILKTIDSTTPNYMMKLGRMVLMPPTTGSTVILYSITNTKSFRITNLGTSGNLCIYNEPSGTVSRCYYGTPSSTLFFFAFSGTTAAGFDDTVPPAIPDIVGTVLFTSVTSDGILYLRDDESLCYNKDGALPPIAATSCLLF